MAEEYREHRPPPDLAATVACLWERRPRCAGPQLIVPDGCIDLIWLAGEGLVIAGPDTAARAVPLAASTAYTGVRLRPGAAGAFLGRPAVTVLDHQVPAEELLGRSAQRLAHRLASADEPARLRLLAGAVRARAATADPLVVAASARLRHARVAAVAYDLGVSERQLHRRTVAAVGYPPKVLARVLRLRRLARVPADSLAARALAAGYASQAHMSDEVRRLTGLTARQYLATLGVR